MIKIFSFFLLLFNFISALLINQGSLKEMNWSWMKNVKDLISFHLRLFWVEAEAEASIEQNSKIIHFHA